MKTQLMILALTVVLPLDAQRMPVPLSRLAGHIDLNGTPSEAAWQSVSPCEIAPGRVVRAVYDDHNIYVSGSFYGPRSSNDVFYILVGGKPYGVTPDGKTVDPLLDEDGDKPSSQWETQWFAATTSQKDAWFTEIRIPYRLTKDTELWIEYDDASR